ncbi:MAG: hypothetical protein FWE45_00300 [Firmicutes bacterium]|nr:hypothetical protein [Bacillota bacterium]
MKKLLVIGIVLCMTIFLTGCATITASVTRLSDGRVVQTIIINFENAPSQTKIMEIEAFIGKEGGYLDVARGIRYRYYENGDPMINPSTGLQRTFMYDKTKNYGWLSNSPNTFVLTLTFNNIHSFHYFNEIHEQVQEVTIERGIFFVERTITMQNPFRTFFENEDSNRSMGIINHFKYEFNATTDDLSFIYVIGSSFRRTDTNATTSRRASNGDYYYYFAATSLEDVQDIVVFDRFANTPAWYGVGIGATLLFMGIFFILAKKKGESK